MMIYDVVKVLEFAKENNLKVGTKEGLLITDAEGCIVFESNSKTKCFQQAVAWINGNECENLFKSRGLNALTDFMGGTRW